MMEERGDLQTSFNRPGVTEYLLKVLTSKDKKRPLYSHQIEAVLSTREYFSTQQDTVEGSPPAIIVLPTGCGRTGVAIVTAYALDDVHRVLVISPSEPISNQIYMNFVAGKGKKPFMVNRMILRDSQCIPSCGQIMELRDLTSNNLSHDLLIVSAPSLHDDVVLNIPPSSYDLVIINEAHHYPISTWKIVTEYFKSAKKIFLTATPFYKGERVLVQDHISFELSQEEAIEKGLVRDLIFDEEPFNPEDDAYEDMSKRIFATLNMHDEQDKGHTHQAMVLVWTVEEAKKFIDVYNNYVSADTGLAVFCTSVKGPIIECFKKNQYRVLVVAGQCTEGFTHKSVSVVAIATSISREYRILFAQFVGRVLGKAHSDENIDALLITHPWYNQKKNFDEFYEIAAT